MFPTSLKIITFSKRKGKLSLRKISTHKEAGTLLWVSLSKPCMLAEIAVPYTRSAYKTACVWLIKDARYTILICCNHKPLKLRRRFLNQVQSQSQLKTDGKWTLLLPNTHLRLQQFAGQCENIWKVSEQELEELQMWKWSYSKDLYLCKVGEQTTEYQLVCVLLEVPSTARDVVIVYVWFWNTT